MCIDTESLYYLLPSLKIYNKDFINTVNIIDNNSIDLIITSPPYNVEIDYNYHKDNVSYTDYIKFSEKWLKKCYDVAKNDGRLCVNVPLNKNKNGIQPFHADFVKTAQSVGWHYHTTIIWHKHNISRRTAWGSWMSASAPYVIAPVETIIVMYKHSWKKTSGTKESDITKEEFIAWTNGLWSFSGEHTKRVNHPAPFPVELPTRCIKLFSFVNDIVLDPFVGSGTTLVAAHTNNRQSIGIDIDNEYCETAFKRLCKVCNLEK